MRNRRRGILVESSHVSSRGNVRLLYRRIDPYRVDRVVGGNDVVVREMALRRRCIVGLDDRAGFGSRRCRASLLEEIEIDSRGRWVNDGYSGCSDGCGNDGSFFEWGMMILFGGGGGGVLFEHEEFDVVQSSLQ